MSVTAQVPDEVTYRQRRFALTAIEGDGLFDPGAHGMHPRPTSTGCYRGAVCHYRVRRRRLLLDELELGSAHRPDLARATPQPDDREVWRYRDVGLPVHFTGRMLVGRGDVANLPYLNMGFWPAWMYAEVYDLVFDGGVLGAAVDVSTELDAVRRDLGAAVARPDAGESTGDWITRTFSLTYAYSWPRTW
jgi:hypothetical protein